MKINFWRAAFFTVTGSFIVVSYVCTIKILSLRDRITVLWFWNNEIFVLICPLAVHVHTSLLEKIEKICPCYSVIAFLLYKTQLEQGLTPAEIFKTDPVDILNQ